MPRELELGGILFPSLLAIFIGAGLVFWLLDAVLARVGIYRAVWHPSLFRVCLFALLFSGLSLLVY